MRRRLASLGTRNPPRAPASDGHVTGSPPSTSPQFSSRAESQGSLTHGQSEEQRRVLHGAAISSVRKEASLSALSLSLSSKGNRRGHRNPRSA